MSESRLRRSVRVLLVDGSRRVLLLRLRAGVDGMALWIAPGGGLEAGESPVDAARRELVEELGVRLEPGQLTGPVWRQRIVQDGLALGWDGVDATYLLARVDDIAPDRPAVLAEWAVEGIADADWWGADRMRDEAGTAVFSPRALPDLLEQLLDGASGTAPLQLGL